MLRSMKSIYKYARKCHSILLLSTTALNVTLFSSSSVSSEQLLALFSEGISTVSYFLFYIK